MQESTSYDKQANVTLYATDGYSGSDDDVANTRKYSAVVDLRVYTGLVVDITFDGNNNTDDLTLTYYRRITNSTFTGNEIAVATATIGSDGSEDVYSYVIDDPGPGYYRLGLVSAGASTTFDVKVLGARYRKSEKYK